jgi:tetratricopeptide (TPR) repeat protein
MKRFNVKDIRLIYIYLMIVASLFALSGPRILHDVRIVTLNRIKPQTFQSLIDFAKDKKSISKKELSDYIFYYKKVSQYVEPSSDMFALLGFCQYLNGDKEEAVRSYKQAVKLDPNFFWNHYNLGVMAFNDQKYLEAAAYFEAASKADIDKTALAILSSLMIYMPLTYNGTEEMTAWLDKRLEKGYKQNEILRKVSQYRMNKQIDEKMEVLSQTIEQGELMPEVF